MTEAAPKSRRRARWLAEARSLLGLALLVVGIHSLVAKPFYIPSESMMPTLLVGDRLAVSRWPYGWSYVSPSFHLLPFVHGRLLGRMPERGDIVIVTPPDAARRGEDLIKRVIGLPGDMVQMVDGRLWLNGRPVRAEDRGRRLLPVDANFRCDPTDADPERAFPGYAAARAAGADGLPACRLHVIRETLPNGATYETLDFGPGEHDDTLPYRVQPGHLFLLGDNRDVSADSRVPIARGGLGGAVPVENIGGRAEIVTFSLDGSASLNPLSWLKMFRGARAGTSLRPAVRSSRMPGRAGAAVPPGRVGPALLSRGTA